MMYPIHSINTEIHNVILRSFEVFILWFFYILNIFLTTKPSQCLNISKRKLQLQTTRCPLYPKSLTSWPVITRVYCTSQNLLSVLDLCERISTVYESSTNLCNSWVLPRTGCSNMDVCWRCFPAETDLGQTSPGSENKPDSCEWLEVQK
jgi:hypothetical protein